MLFYCFFLIFWVFFKIIFLFDHKFKIMTKSLKALTKIRNFLIFPKQLYWYCSFDHELRSNRGLKSCSVIVVVGDFYMLRKYTKYVWFTCKLRYRGLVELLFKWFYEFVCVRVCVCARKGGRGRAQWAEMGGQAVLVIFEAIKLKFSQKTHFWMQK